MACGHTGDWSWCQQCMQQQEAEANEFRRQRETSLTARVAELEGTVADLRTGMLLIWGSCEAHAHHEISTAELVRMVREEVSRALQARGEDDGE